MGGEPRATQLVVGEKAPGPAGLSAPLAIMAVAKPQSVCGSVVLNTLQSTADQLLGGWARTRGAGAVGEGVALNGYGPR